jgi:hypothetical protein
VKQNNNQLKNIKQRGSKERKKILSKQKNYSKKGYSCLFLIKIKIDPFYSTICYWCHFWGYNFHAIFDLVVRKYQKVESSWHRIIIIHLKLKEYEMIKTQIAFNNFNNFLFGVIGSFA